MTDRPSTRKLLARSAAEVGELDPVAARAELLVALAHLTRDRDVWGGDRAITYWDRLPDRVRTACYAGPTLARWWERMASTLGCNHPGQAEDRTALAAVLAGGDDAAVLDVLRTHTEALCLRVRLANQTARDDRQKPTDTQETML